jgi:hypothetical protein
MQQAILESIIECNQIAARITDILDRSQDPKSLATLEETKNLISLSESYFSDQSIGCLLAYSDSIMEISGYLARRRCSPWNTEIQEGRT